MKKIALILSIVLFSACAKNSILIMPLPSFQAEFKEISHSIDQAAYNYNLLQMQTKNEYSSYFEGSILKIRLDEELKLLAQKLEEASVKLLLAKGYDLSKTKQYKLKENIIVLIKEEFDREKTDLLKGKQVSSNLSLELEFRASFNKVNDKNKIQTQTGVKTKLEPIAINYPIKSDEGISTFKESISSIPTQVNANLKEAVFDIDEVFRTFYYEALNSLNENIKAKDSQAEAVRMQTQEGIIIFE